MTETPAQMAARLNRMQAAGRKATDDWVKNHADLIRRNGITIDDGLHNMLHTMFVAGWLSREADDAR